MTQADDLEYLFSYGTLQQHDVQVANFGRVLDGQPDSLPGHALTTVKITDPDVIAVSGSDEHPMLVPSQDPRDTVSGTALALAASELLAADAYEVDDYARTRATLTSGRSAWVYLDRRHVG
jgi:hypothetical protein